MYPEDMIAPMRAELANSGYAETKTPEEVTAAITAEGTTLVVHHNGLLPLSRADAERHPRGTYANGLEWRAWL